MKSKIFHQFTFSLFHFDLYFSDDIVIIVVVFRSFHVSFCSSDDIEPMCCAIRCCCSWLIFVCAVSPFEL